MQGALKASSASLLPMDNVCSVMQWCIVAANATLCPTRAVLSEIIIWLRAVDFTTDTN